MTRQTFFRQGEESVEGHWERRGQQNRAVLEGYLKDASRGQAELLSVIRQWLAASEPDGQGGAEWVSRADYDGPDSILVRTQTSGDAAGILAAFAQVDGCQPMGYIHLKSRGWTSQIYVPHKFE